MALYLIFMIIVIFILYVLAAPFYAYSRAWKNHASYIPLMLMASVCLLYPFVLLGLADIGFYCIAFAVLVVYFFAVRNLIKRNTGNILKFFDAGTLTYIVLVPVLYLLTQSSIVSLWDELRLWGAVPRYLYFQGTTYLGMDSTIYTEMQNYPPAMQLFQYFVMKLNFAYADPILFFAYAAFAASFMIPAISNQKWCLFLLPIYVLAIVFLPQAYANSYEFDSNFYYTSLFIDPFIGILIGYLFYQVAQNPFADSKQTVIFALSLFLLVLTKEAGLLYDLPILLFALLLYAKQIIKRKYVWSILTVLAPLAAYFSYRYALTAYGVYEPSSLNINAIWELLRNPTEEQASIIQEYFALLPNKILVIQGNLFTFFGLPDFITPLTAVLLNLGISLIAVLLGAKEKRARSLVAVLFAAVFVFLFYLSLLPVYVFKIGHAEFTFPSFQRYLSTALIAQMLLPVMLLFQSLCERRKGLRVGIAAIVLAAVYLVFPIGMPKETGYQWARKEAEAQYAVIEKGIPESNKKLFLIMNNAEGDDILIHHQLYYLLMDRNINVDNTMFEIDWLNNIAPDDLAEQLKSYDYMYLYADYEGIFAENYAHLFEGEVSDRTLYTVIKNDSGIRLQPVRGEN